MVLKILLLHTQERHTRAKERIQESRYATIMGSGSIAIRRNAEPSEIDTTLLPRGQGN